MVAGASDRSGWRSWFSWVGLLAAGFTTLCCLGISAALSLATAVGTTFLTEDSTLKPILAATLAFTILGSVLTFWRHRHPGTLVLTTLAAVWIYAVIFVGVSGVHHEGSHDHVSNHAGGPAHAGLTGGRLALAWIGLTVLIGAQAWDLIRIRRAREQAA